MHDFQNMTPESAARQVDRKFRRAALVNDVTEPVTAPDTGPNGTFLASTGTPQPLVAQPISYQTGLGAPPMSPEQQEKANQDRRDEQRQFPPVPTVPQQQQPAAVPVQQPGVPQPPAIAQVPTAEPAVSLPQPEEALQLQPEGVPWDTPTSSGGLATSVIVPGTGGQTIDTTIRNADGTVTQMRSVSDGNGGVTTWTANADGSYSVRYPDGTHGAPPAQATIYTVPVGMDPSGPAPIASDITADGKQVRTTARGEDGTVSTAASVLNPDGSVNTTYPDGQGGTYTTTSRSNGNGGFNQSVTGQHSADGSGYQIEFDGVRIDRDVNGHILVTGTSDGTSYQTGTDEFGRPFEVLTDMLHRTTLKTWIDEFGRSKRILTDAGNNTITTSVVNGGNDGANRPWIEVTVTDLQGNPIAHFTKGGDGGVRTDDGFIHFEVEGQDVKYNKDGTVYVPDDHSTAWQRFIGTDPQPKVYFDRHGNPQLTRVGPFVPEMLTQIYPPGNVPGEAFYKTPDGTLIIKDKNGYHWGHPYDGPATVMNGPPIRIPGGGPSVPGEGVPPSRQRPGASTGRGMGALEGETPGPAAQFRAAPAAGAAAAEANLTRVTAAASASEASEAAAAARTRPSAATPESPATTKVPASRTDPPTTERAVPAIESPVRPPVAGRTQAQTEAEAQIEQRLPPQADSRSRAPAPPTAPAGPQHPSAPSGSKQTGPAIRGGAQAPSAGATSGKARELPPAAGRGDAPNHAVQSAFDDLPAFTKKGVDASGEPTLQSPTSGLLLNKDGTRVGNSYSTGSDLIESGGINRSPAIEINQRIKDSPSKIPGGSSKAGWSSDVEMKAAEIMRKNGIKDAELVINHPFGPCRGCDLTLKYVLEPGSRLTVRWPGGSHTYVGVKW
ncbi:DddA-like double-stranded DNA deaminase toxin [Nocardia suismassiliense]|uniref:DddA-like double-stranded DNA deaminase toxin n=1 Tax=Nocardia suismassiliense TaxID=2077092 RepID=UPI001F40F2AF|nr:DddA-like double-stranded DNA deaminase toxin [Nocardia suismassiliense]